MPAKEEKITIPYGYEPREYQKRVWNWLADGKGKRATMVWHRRAGKDLFSLNYCIWNMVKRPGLYWHVFPYYKQGKRAIWEGRTKEGRKFLDHIPKQMIESQNNNDLKISLKNGSTYQVVGADNPEGLVGAGPYGVIFSEFDLMPKNVFNLISPMLRENGGWAIFIFTPHGRNHGYDHWVRAQEKEDHYTELLTVEDTKQWTGIDPEQLVIEERENGMSEEKIQSEYFCSFDAPVEGSYYGKTLMQMEKDEHFVRVPYEPRLLVNTAWDIGVGDSTAIWFYQIHGDEVRVIDYYEAHSEGLPHYVKILNQKNYTYGKHYVPHDMEVRDFTTGKSRVSSARSLGIKMTVLAKLGVDEGIDLCRSILPRCWFDKKKCELGIDALRAYHKEYDDKRDVYLNSPCHDWASHGADAFRYMCQSLKRFGRKEQKRQKKIKNEYRIKI